MSVAPTLVGAGGQLAVRRALRPLLRDRQARAAVAIIGTLVLAAGAIPHATELALAPEVLGIAIATLDAWRATVVPAAAATLLAAVVGIALGVLVAASPDALRTIVTPALRAIAALPVLLLVLASIALAGVHDSALLAALAAGQCMRYGRDACMLAERESRRAYVEAARGFGLGESRIWRNHVLPNCAGQLAALPLCGALRAAVLTHATVAFLGLVPEGDASLGPMIASAPVPAAVTAAAVLCLSLLALHVLAQRLRALGVGA